MKGVFLPLQVTAISPLHIKTPAFGKHVLTLPDPSSTQNFRLQKQQRGAGPMHILRTYLTTSGGLMRGTRGQGGYCTEPT